MTPAIPSTATTTLAPTDLLPLTCTREGTCCHGKIVWLNPWELARLAAGRNLSAPAFRAAHVDHGIRLRFTGPPGKLGAACSQYGADQGCLAHPQRPLACRLYPLGREKRGKDQRYVYEGVTFPCLTGCPNVTTLPRLAVADYLAQQGVGPGETAQDAYVDMAKDLAEGAFVVLFDSGLAKTTGAEVLARWQTMIQMNHAQRVAAIGPQWFDRLTAPAISSDIEQPAEWIAAHRADFQHAAQESFGTLRDAAHLADASVRFLALAMHVMQAVGAADPHDIGTRWLRAAQAQLAMKR